MRKILDVKENRINLSDYDLYMPNITHIWAVANHNFSTDYKYNPENGMEISEENLESWYIPYFEGLKLIDPGEYRLNIKENILEFSGFQTIKSICVLVEYIERKCKDCPNLKKGGFDEKFCAIAGSSKSENSTCDTSEKNVFKTGNVYGRVNNIKQKSKLTTKTNDSLENSLDDLIKRCRYKLTELYEENDRISGDETIINMTEWIETLTTDLCSVQERLQQNIKDRLQVGDYVEGYEPYGTKVVYIRGTITNIAYEENGSIKRCEIQCDDSYNGSRGNSLKVDYPIKRMKREKNWWLNVDQNRLSSR